MLWVIPDGDSDGDYLPSTKAGVFISKLNLPRCLKVCSRHRKWY